MSDSRAQQYFFVASIPFKDGEKIPTGKEYEAHAGIKSGNLATEELPKKVEEFLIEVFAQGHTVLGGDGDWGYQSLQLDPNGPARQVVNFQLRAGQPGDGRVEFNLYFKNRWLRQIAFPLMIVASVE